MIKFGMMAVVLLWGVQGCTFTNPPATSSLPTVSQASTDALSAVEQSIYQQVNQYRQSLNLPPLKLDAQIVEQARQHSEAMASRAQLSHEGFEGRAKALAPYSRVAENVAFNYGYSDPATQAVQGWIDSSGHRQNIEGQWSWTGIGVSQTDDGKYYFTQIFGER